MVETVKNKTVGSKVTEEKVDSLFLLCLFRGGDKKKARKITCFKTDVVFDVNTLTEYEEEIAEMINNLSEHFRSGASFIWACVDKYGRTWTTDEDIMQELFLLGLAVGRIRHFEHRQNRRYEALPWFIFK